MAPGADRDPGGGGILRDRPFVDHPAVRVEQVERDGAAPVTGTGRAVDARHRRAVAVALGVSRQSGLTTDRSSWFVGT
jgi:hypothetical protein